MYTEQNLKLVEITHKSFNKSDDAKISKTSR